MTGTLSFQMTPIGTIQTPYHATKEIPKGLGAAHDAEGVLALDPQLEAGLTDIDGFSHLYVVWAFHRSEGFDLIGTPPCDNRPHGVFATRSPRRPNPIGLTVVQLLRRDGSRLYVRGVDMLDGTPLLDIKPYLSSVPDESLTRGWLAEAEARQDSEAEHLHVFTPRTADLAGRFAVEGPIDAIFELFSPLGERAWISGWNPELLDPPGVSWERGQIFRTLEEEGPAFWIVTALDRDAHSVEYHRVEPTRYVARVRVRCAARPDGSVDVTVSYTFIGLSRHGNEQISAMSGSAYAEKMQRWQNWITELRSSPRR